MNIIEWIDKKSTKAHSSTVAIYMLNKQMAQISIHKYWYLLNAKGEYTQFIGKLSIKIVNELNKININFIEMLWSLSWTWILFQNMSRTCISSNGIKHKEQKKKKHGKFRLQTKRCDIRMCLIKSKKKKRNVKITQKIHKNHFISAVGEIHFA